jgi:hypothetical protein
MGVVAPGEKKAVKAIVYLFNYLESLTIMNSSKE